MNENQLLTTTDGKVWADEFIRIIKEKNPIIDVNFMTTRFCNAIEAGRSNPIEVID